MSNFTLGEKIRRIRKSLNLNQADFADKLGFKSATAISKFEDNSREPDKNKLIEIAKLGNVSLDDLLSGEGVSLNHSTPVIKSSVSSTPNVPEFSIAEDLTLAAKVLESRTHYATSLHLNIRSFFAAVEDTSMLKQLRNVEIRLEEMEGKIQTLQNENNRLGNEVKRLTASPTTAGQQKAL